MKRFSHTGAIKDQYIEQLLFLSRARIALVGIVVLLLSLLGRYAWLQFVAYESYSLRSEDNRVSVRPLAPNRGLIYDRRGRLIAENQPAYRLEVTPEQVEDIEALLEQLSAMVALDDEDRASFQRSLRHYRDFDSIPLKFNLSEQEVARFSVNRHHFNGVDVVPYLSRHYPYGEILTHVLGYIGRMDESDMARVDTVNYRGTRTIGKTGIEQYRENLLHGEVGFERVETNVRGRVLQVLERQPAVPGTDLVLSIDVTVQRAAWEALGDRPGAVVAIDPTDGSVIALVSKPAYDPNAFVRGLSHRAYQAILEAPGRPLFNRALSGGYEPGSTIKPFVGLAGLEMALVEPRTRVLSNGEFYIDNYSRAFRDWKDDGHGLVTMAGALEESVNTYFYQLALDMGIDRMHDYLALFGFGEVTGIDLTGEGKGLLPSRQWKMAAHGTPWYTGETVIAGIGQGFNVVTPMQLANAVATLVNGGQRYAPRLLYATKPAGEGRAERHSAPVVMRVPVEDPENWQVIFEGMDRVVNGVLGTARRIAAESRHRTAGKTGTAQVYQLNEDKEYEEEQVAYELRDHALFIAFAPVEAPRIAVAVIGEHAGAGSSAAAPVARAVVDSWLDQEIRP